jgi:hypothetical protein
MVATENTRLGSLGALTRATRSTATMADGCRLGRQGDVKGRVMSAMPDLGSNKWPAVPLPRLGRLLVERFTGETSGPTDWNSL